MHFIAPFLLAAMVIAPAAEAADPAPWTYPEGSSWTSTCEAPTEQQSPIKLSGISTTPLVTIAQEQGEPTFSAPDQNVVFSAGLRVSPAFGHDKAITYAPASLHFHAKSEHILRENSREDLEVHIKGSYGGETVVFAALFDKSGKAGDPGTAFLTSGLSALKTSTVLNPEAVLGMFDRGGFYVYTGSLTTPPCSTQVNFYVLGQPVPVEASVLDSFVAALQAAKMPKDNYRPIKPLLPDTKVFFRADQAEIPAAVKNVRVSALPTGFVVKFDPVQGATEYTVWAALLPGTAQTLCGRGGASPVTCSGMTRRNPTRSECWPGMRRVWGRPPTR